MLKLRFRDRDGRELGGADMRVLEHRPGERVLWETLEGPPAWVGTRVRFDLLQQGELCVVLFSHIGWREADEFMHHCSTKWGTFLISLKAQLETGRGAPNPGDLEIGNWH